MTMLDVQKYRKKPVEIEAYCYDQKRENSRPDWLMDAVTANTVITYPDHAIIKTLEGNMRAELGDWIIKGVKGEFYPCKPDIFEATYEPALSTVTPAEVGGLVERLRDVAGFIQKEHGRVAAAACLATEAASLIQSQAARIAELAEAWQRYVDANEARIDAEAQLAERGKPFIAAAEEAYWLLAWTWQSHLTGPGKPFDMSIFAPEARNMMTKAERDLFDALSEIEP